MKYRVVSIALAALIASTATFAADRSMTIPGEADFMFIGENGLEGKAIGDFRSCSENNADAKKLLGSRFKQWIDEISQTAQQKMFELKRCELMGIYVIDQPGRKYRTVNDLEQRAQGLSVYEVNGAVLKLVKAFGTPAQYIVVVPEVAKEGLELADLNICMNPEKKDTFRRKAKRASNCHDLDQSLWVFEKYKKYPGPLQDNSSLFDAKDFDALNKKGKFKGLRVYKLVGDKLEPVE